ncbi:unnamed protein product [Vitrella brassicaformis CCMP3155]|uniref:SET domain-containing protein n=2 Tax=Vitrella brassicaformis TaxID=1169539 RepID=A0A0G4G9R9_VITBC|nr:unnamed protein product [Vitrella brassicaformis CCMP3155]|mmetsp:Transcript_47987/g.120105  ORF Transcript_47987/g.120105 Transcript_47987/m.120105 type:complete len:531 (+) Transcript_47987:57-1649(+)|eukprot:CEM25451.1 unnamed protein product [Vitrella brassicaformis CCMP3155]
MNGQPRKKAAKESGSASAAATSPPTRSASSSGSTSNLGVVVLSIAVPSLAIAVACVQWGPRDFWETYFDVRPKDGPLDVYKEWEAMKKWVRQRDSFVHDGIALTPPDRPVRGVITTQSLEKNTLLIQVPIKNHLTLPNAKMRSELPGRVEAIPGLALQHPALGAYLTAEVQKGVKSYWYPYTRVIGEEAYDTMIFFQPERRLKLLEGSPEYELASRSKAWYDRDHTKIVANLDRQDIGAFNKTAFISSCMSIATRSFSTRHGFALVMVADMMNHGHHHNAEWNWDESTDSLKITTKEFVNKGQEIFLSYGTRSNAQLFSVYGFTLEPRHEPSHTFRIWTSELQKLKKDYDPSWVAVDMRLNTWVHGIPQDLRTVSSKVINSTSSSVSSFEDAIEWWESAFSAFMARYENDTTITPFIKLLKDNRNIATQSWVWWTELKPAASKTQGGVYEDGLRIDGTWWSKADDQSVSKLTGLDGLWRTNVIRAKMSEYLALTCYKEAALILRGELHENVTLPRAVTVAKEVGKWILNS